MSQQHLFLTIDQPGKHELTGQDSKQLHPKLLMILAENHWDWDNIRLEVLRHGVSFKVFSSKDGKRTRYSYYYCTVHGKLFEFLKFCPDCSLEWTKNPKHAELIATSRSWDL